MSTSELVLEETPYLNLTTRGRKTGLKHDVELWFAFEDGRLYFLAHESSHWWKNVVKTPRGEVEVSEILFEGTGRLVSEKREDTFELFRGKYGREQVERWYGGERTKRIAGEIQLGRVWGKKSSGKGSMDERAGEHVKINRANFSYVAPLYIQTNSQNLARRSLAQ